APECATRRIVAMGQVSKTKPVGKPKPYLSQFDNVKPEGTLPLFKFEEPGQKIVAKFLGRRECTTKIGNSKILDVEIQENNGPERGEHSIFESGHLTTIFDRYQLQPGDVFYLRLDSIDGKTKFKRFAFKLISGNGRKQSPAADDDIPF